MAGYTRPKMANFIFLFSLVFLFLDVNANDCTAGCKGGTDPKEGFLKGHTYKYSLEGFVNVFLTGADKQETQAKISAQATVYALGNCAHLLKVTSVQFTGPDGKKYAGSEDFLKPVQFTMQDGVVSPRICAEENDSEKSLNVKRAILSLLQTATQQKTEVDIFGVCPTKFTNTGNRVQKKKDLNLCKGHSQTGHDALYQFYSSDATFKNAHIMKGSLKSETQLISGIVQLAFAQEEYFYRPFSIGQSGAKAVAGSRLELKETNEGTLTANCVVPKAITFEISKTSHNENSLENIQNALKTATQYLDGHVQPKSASFFTALIRVLRGSKTDDIYKVYTKIVNDSSYANKELAQKVYLDALFRCGTGDSIEVTIKLVKEKHLNPLQTRLAFASLTSVRYASVGSLNAVTDLLDFPDLPNEVYLGAGALAAAHYREHARSDDHHISDAIIALSAKLVSKLGTCQATTKSDENKIIIILKALKNIRNIEDNAVETLVKCASDKSVEQRVRVAALETFTSGPCIEKLQTVAFKILEDIDEDSETRIKAYLALIECPSKHLSESIKKLLDADTVYQVASFITSSLINIQSSHGKTTHAARMIFKSFNFTTPYPMDARKYSQAYRAVYDIQGSDIHPVIQSNIIYSQNSFVPRSVNLNLTAEVFGKDINLIEFGARQGNLNRVLEEYFGPKGSFRSPQHMYDSWKETTDNVYEKLQKRLNKAGSKAKRDVQEQIAALGKKLKTDIGEYKGNFDLDVFVKLFGSEAIFLSLGDDQHFSVEAIIDRIFNYIEGGIDSAKKFSHEVRSHILFLDMELAYPTSSGMSLKLNAEGATTSKLTFGGDFDFRQLFGDIFNAKVDFELQPSASVEIVGTLSVDADAFSTGLKVITTLQTSTGVHITGKLLDGKGFDVKVGLPLERQEIITATNDVVFYTRERGHMDVDKEIAFNNPSYEPLPDCYEKLAKTTGLTVCFEEVKPAKSSLGTLAQGEARFPLNGPASYAMYLEKAGIKSYNFRGLLTENENGITWDMSIDAEGAKLPTKFTAKIENTDTEFTISALLDSPIKRIAASTVFRSTHDRLTIGAELLYGDDLTKGEIGYYVEIKDIGFTLHPIVDFVKSGYKANILHAVGMLHVEEHYDEIKFTFDGLGLVLGDDKATIDGTTLTKSTQFTWDLKGAGPKHTASYTGKIVFHDKNERIAEIDFQNSYKPQCNFLFKGSLKDKEVEDISIYDIEFSLVHGADRESKLNLINFNLHYDADGEFNKMNIKEIVTYPVYGFESIKELVYADDEKFLFTVDGKFMKHTLDFAVHLESNKTEDTELARLKGIYDGIGGEAYLMVDNKVENTTKYTSYLLISPDRKYEAITTMKGFKVTEQNYVDLHFITAMTFPNKDIYTFDSMLYAKERKILKTKTSFAKGTVNYFEFNAKLDNIRMLGDGKVFIKDLILFKANYDIKQKDIKIGVTTSVELYKFDRVYQLEGELVGNSPKITGEWKLYTDYSKDKTKFYLLTTSNVLQDGKVDSKNVIINGEEQTKLNFILTKDSDKGFYSLDANIIDARENVYKIVYSHKDLVENELRNIDVQFRLENMDKDGASIIKIIWDTKVDDYNEESELGSAYTTLTMENKLGENMAYHLEAAAKQTDSKYEEEYKLDIYGSIFSGNLSSHVRYEIDDGNIDYKLNLVAGQVASLALKGKFIFDDKEQKYRNYVNLLALSQAEKFFFELDQIFRSKKIEGSEYYTFSEIQSNARFDIDMASNVFNLHLVNEDTEQSGKVFIQLPKLEPFILELSNSQKFNTNGNKLHTSSNLYSSIYGQKMSFNITGDSIYHFVMDGDYKIELLLPEKLGSKTVSTNFIYTYLSKNDFKFDVTTECDSKKYNYVIIYEFDTLDNLHADIKVTHPDSETKRVYVKTEHLSRPEFNAHAIIQNYRDFDMDVAVIGKLKSVEDFKITMDVDCAKAAFNKVHFEAVNEPDDKQQHVKVIATEKGESLLDGVITYTTKIENEMLFVIGTGKLTLRGKEETAKFQYSHKDKDENTTSFVGSIGAYEFMVTQYSAKDAYNYITSYCVAESDCANFDLKSKIVVVPGAKPSKHFEIDWDLRKFGLPSEFRLSTVTQYDHRLPIFSFTAHLTQDGHYYEVKQVMQTLKDRFETLHKITIPTREIHLTTSNSYFTKRRSFFDEPLYGEVILYLNKNDAKSKTHFKTNLDFSDHYHKQRYFDAEIFFVYPGMSKEWQVLADCKYDTSTHHGTLNTTFDIFKEKDQRVALIGSFGPKSIGDYSIDYEAVIETDGKGLDIKYYGSGDLKVGTKGGMKLELHSLLGVGKENMDYKFLYAVNQGEQQLLMKYPAGNLLHYKNTYEMEGTAMPTRASWNTSLTLYNDLMYKTHGNIDWHDGLHATWKAGCEKTATMLTLSGAIVPGRKMEVLADYTATEGNFPLLTIGYDIPSSKSLASTCKANKDGLRTFLDGLVTNWKIFATRQYEFKEENYEMEEKFDSLLKKTLVIAKLNFHSTYYHDQTVAILNEFKADGFLKIFEKPFELSMTMWFAFTEAMSDISSKTCEMYDTINKFWFSDDPAQRSSPVSGIDTLVEIVSQSFDRLVDVTVRFVSIVDTFIEKYGPFWNHIYTFVDDVRTTYNNLVQKLTDDVPKVYNGVKSAVKDSFLVRVIEGRFKFFTNENLEKYFKHIEDAYKEILPEREWNHFKRTVLYFNDLDSHRNETAFDEIKYTDIVYAAKKVVVAAAKIILTEFGLDVNFHFDVFTRIISRSILADKKMHKKSSTFMKLQKSKTNNVIFEDVIHNMERQNHMILPNKLRAFIAGGHFFTFDEIHYYFPGNCMYVLAHDAVDGNFTIAMELEKGKPKSVRLADKSGSWVQVDSHGKILEGEGTPMVQVFKRGNMFVIKSSYGASIKCTYGLDICYFKVSGYYYGKLRGLLGDGNDEQKDDYRLPDGKIVSSEYQFANAYALSSECATIIAPELSTYTSDKDTDNSENEESEDEDSTNLCSELFGQDSDFSGCYAYVHPYNYGSACRQVVAAALSEDEKSAACLMAKTYALAANAHKCKVTIPDTCILCEADGDTYNANDASVTVNTPKNKADIVVVVEMTTSNKETFENVVMPVMEGLLGELKTREMDDVNVHLVGIKQDIPYPIFYDIEKPNMVGNKMTFDDKERSSDFARYKMPYYTNVSKVDEFMEVSLSVLHYVNQFLGYDDMFLAYWRLRELQLRPNATKTLILVHPRPCPTGLIPILTNYYDQYSMKEEGAVAHLISYMPESNLDNYPDVVGFNDDKVYSIGKEPTLREKIHYSDDECAKFSLGTYGNIYPTKSFSKMDAMQKEKYLGMAVKTIADSITNYSYEKECSCKLGFMDLFPQVTCETVSRMKITA